MPEYNASTGRESTFGRGLMNYIAQKMPYSNQNLINDVQRMNPKFKYFYDTGTQRDEQINQLAVSTHPSADNLWAAAAGGMHAEQQYHNYMYANLDQDKSKRLRDYRVMAAFSEVADALDEICDEVIVENDDGNVIELQVRNRDFSDSAEKALQKEAKKFFEFFDFENKGWEYFRTLMIDGELFFENVIHKKHHQKGILGVMQMPSDLIDPIYDNVQNQLLRGFMLRKPKDPDNIASKSTGDPNKIDLVPFDKNQVTYVNSGVWNEDKTIRVPFIENARRSYRQLSLIEDAIVIYRLVRAPERLVFNVDVGNMPAPKAEAYLKRLMQNYWSRKTYDSNQGGSVQAFNPQSMLDSFWFPKRQGSDGTQVEQLQGGQNLGQLEDLLYFVRKLYKSLKVPVNRVDPESQYNATDATMLREELKFANFVVRLQENFAQGLKHAFVTHLKLKDMWDELKLKENHFDIKFCEPRNFRELRAQQILELKYNNYNNFSQNELVSNSYAQKKYLGWSDLQIKANREWLRKDSSLKWELGQIEAAGPEWDKMPAAGAPGAEDPMGMGAPGGGAPLGGGAPPEFGPGPGGDIGAPGEAPAEPAAEPPAAPAPPV
jgi:hypothetical protein